MTPKQEKGETMDGLQDKHIQETDNDSDRVLENEIRVEMKDDENHGRTDVMPQDHVVRKLDSFLSEEGLNIGKDEYCYITIVDNHLEIGRAKITLEK